MNYAFQQISAIVNAKSLGFGNSIIEEIVTDTRAFFHAEKSLFIALKGAKRDGHLFIETAYKKGIRYFLVEHLPNEKYENANFILAPNALLALQQLASHHRKQFDLTTISITGSHGKTMIKEWLHQLIWQDFSVVKSPKSYNSQLGVPLSVLGIEKNHTLGIFEAGISLPNEMERLENIIQPTIGIITNITDAHLQNFDSYEDLVNEKVELVKNCQKIIVNADNEIIISKIKHLNPSAEIFAWGKNENATVKLFQTNKLNNQTEIVFVYLSNDYKIKIPFSDYASIENVCTIFSILVALEIDLHTVIPRFEKLTPVEMRLEINEGINQCVIINDGYNSDLHSIRVALEVLVQQKKSNKTLILSDLNESDENETNYQTLAKWVNESEIQKVILIGEGIMQFKQLFNQQYLSYKFTQDFLDNLYYETFSDEAILVKGSYTYNFWQISDALTLRSHDTVLEINLHSLVHNLHQFKAKLKPNTKMMCMVKAFGYGTGSYEIAQALEYNGVDYLGVAYADEGAALRKSGISLPIMVMNPEQSSYDIVIKNQLEPEIYSFRVLEKFLRNLDKYYFDKPFPIHIKLDTGMNRLGFKAEEVQKLKELLFEHKNKVEVKSIFTHLSASEDLNLAEFTLNQFNLFELLYNELSDFLQIKPIKHALNSAGILNYTDFQFDMVRLGIGLYGFVYSDKIKLDPVAKFKTVISQIKSLKKGESVSYNRRFIANEDKKIAILPVGYADGIPRILGNGVGYVSIQGERAKILGAICMDTLMVDISPINCKEGDEVCLFGKNPSLEELSKIANTIPYEILTSISQRVKRVYYKE